MTQYITVDADDRVEARIEVDMRPDRMVRDPVPERP